MLLSCSESDFLVSVFGKIAQHSQIIHETFPPEGYWVNLSLAGTYILGLIASYFLVFHKKNNGYIDFIKRVLLPLTTIGGLIIYYIGYHVYEPELLWLVKVGLALFSTARLFILGNDLVEVHNYINPNFLIWFSVFSVSAALISTSVLLNLIGQNIKSWSKIIFNSADQSYIFLGLNNAGFSLAKDIKGKNKNAFIVFIEIESLNDNISLTPKIKEIDALVINNTSFFNLFNLHNEEFLFHPHEEQIEHAKKDNINTFTFKNYFLKKKIKKNPTQLFILSDNENQNFYLSQLFIDEIKNLPDIKQIDIHIRTTSKNVEEIYDNHIETNKNYANIHLHNQSYIIASQLVSNNLPIKWIKNNYPESIQPDATVKRDFTIAFVGFGFTGRAIFGKFFEQGRFIGSNFKAILIDQNMNELEGEFEQKYNGIINELKENILFHQVKANTKDFYSILSKHATNVDFIVVSLGNDELNLKIAHDIKHVIHKIKTNYKILVKASKTTYYENNFSNKDTIQTFGFEHDVFTENIIIKGNLERIAKKIHEYYNNRAPREKQKEWQELTQFTRNSNISAVDHTITKLILAGFEFQQPNNNCLIDQDILSNIIHFQSYAEFENKLGNVKILNLGKTEHLRWNAFHYINGWTKWDLKDIPANTTKNKNEERKIHACLVDWEELDDVSKRFNNEEYKKYDLDCVLDIYNNAVSGLYNPDNKIKKDIHAKR